MGADGGITLPGSSATGRISVTEDALARIVADTAAEVYGVVGLAPRGSRVGLLIGRVRPDQAVEIVSPRDGAVSLGVHVVVEHGLNLAEVSASLCTRVAYEVERLTGLEVAAVEVHVESVREA